MDQDSNTDLADQIADTMTSRAGQVWDQRARSDLAVWLGETENQAKAMQWLSYLATEDPAVKPNPMEEFALRRPLQDVLAGRPSVSVHTEPGSGFIPRYRLRWPWRCRTKPPPIT